MNVQSLSTPTRVDPSLLPSSSPVPSQAPAKATGPADGFVSTAAQPKVALAVPSAHVPLASATLGVVATLTPPSGTLQRGDSGASVKQLQDCLVALGFMTQDQVNTGYGNFGQLTEAALKSFQTKAGLESDGVYGPNTQAAMKKALDAQTPPPTAPAVDLSPGNTGDAVKQLQDCLVYLGYMTQAQVDGGPGVFGPQTETALKAFQADWNVQQTGKLGPTTRQYLQKALAGETPPNTKPTGSLSNEPNHQFKFQELYPTIQKFASKYNVDPKILAGILDQESSFKNFIVHHDGTGHGLVGLDDGGLLSDFEKWSGMKVGRGASAKSIPPELQIEYLAKTIHDLSTNVYHGNQYLAAREWHTGAGGVYGSGGVEYENLVKQRIRELGL